MKILVTGAAGFIGYHLCLKLVNLGYEVFGLDNINDYYSPKLKFDRLEELGLDGSKAKIFKNKITSNKFANLHFIRLDILDSKNINDFFQEEKFEVVCNLAAQAGVRYSIDNPKAYIDSNIVGFFNILEGCRNHKVSHLIYASSSSVYGENKKVPFDTKDNADFPVSLYAATKKSNELMAHSYGHLYGFKTTGLRFFTVYGPWGRPDMAYYRFAESILKDSPIQVFNNGRMQRDFTYIDDIVKGIERIVEKSIESRGHYKVYNIGNNKTESLSDFISFIEQSIGKKAIKIMLPMQKGDVPKTHAKIDDLVQDYDYAPNTDIGAGIDNFVRWFLKYKKLN